MWGRILEIFLALWLISSLFLFARPMEEPAVPMISLIASSAVILFALLSFRPTWEKMHLLNLLVAFWLLGTGFLKVAPLAPALQNYIIVGFILLIAALVPSHSDQPPRSWRMFKP